MTDSDRLKHLEPFIGKWNTTIEMIEGDKTSTHRATDTYRWALGDKFIFHDVSGTMAGQRVETLEIMSVRGPRNYDLRSYDNSGEVADYTASLEGHRWSIDGEKLRFRGAFNEDWHVLEGDWEQRRDGEWTKWLTVKLEKSKD